jgi:hypothetical protein
VVKDRDIVLVCTLNDPDSKTLALLFAARNAKELGARSVGLVAPYLGYMRQDRRFREGEAITSAHFAALVSSSFDWLVTVDPHLHRRASAKRAHRSKRQTSQNPVAPASNVVHRACAAKRDSSRSKNSTCSPFLIRCCTAGSRTVVTIATPPIQRTTART